MLVRAVDQTIEIGARTLVMGILNVTPDSFSDGGRFFDPGVAVARGVEMVRSGADMIDVGGESTRPGSDGVSAGEEIGRVVPVISELAASVDVPISIDTMKAEVAKEAIAAGATIINDLTALGFDPEMTGLAAETGAAVILMHMKGRPRTMQQNPRYDDVVAEVRSYLADAAERVISGGVSRDRVMIDPGIGFGKTFDHNLSLINNLDRLVDLGYPVVLGVSRKAFIGAILGAEVDERLCGGLAAGLMGAVRGAHVIRAHDVEPTVESVRVVDAVRRERV